MKLKLITLITLFLSLAAFSVAGAFTLTDSQHYTRSGNYYVFSHTFESTSDGTSHLILLRTGSSMVHLSIEAAVGGQTKLQLREGVAVSANGTQVTNHKYNRNSDRSSLTKTYQGPTISDAGTIFFEEQTPGGSSVFTRIGGVSRTRPKFILKPDTVYTVNATNKSGSSADINLVGSFYEMNL